MVEGPVAVASSLVAGWAAYGVAALVCQDRRYFPGGRGAPRPTPPAPPIVVVILSGDDDMADWRTGHRQRALSDEAVHTRVRAEERAYAYGVGLDPVDDQRWWTLLRRANETEGPARLRGLGLGR